eukprot:3499681-Rhodomonas_salina.2
MCAVVCKVSHACAAAQHASSTPACTPSHRVDETCARPRRPGARCVSDVYTVSLMCTLCTAQTN